jgi:hypothetical protein
LNLLKRKNSIIFIFVFLSGIVFPQDKITPVEKQARELTKYFTNPAGSDKIFTNAFLAQVPPDKLVSIFKYYYSVCGACTKIVPLKINNDYSAKYDFYFEKNSTVTVTLELESKEPNLINGLFFGPPVTAASSFNDLISELKKLPGETSLLAVKLSNSGISAVAEHNSGSYMAIGSSFKLYILSEILRTINAGEKKWSDVIELKEECRSLPSGFLHSWHSGTNMTIESLASLMISISDNTATDNLLNFAGRENVEKIMAVTGHSKPELNIPFLATTEMFKLKGEPTKQVISKYLDSVDKKKFIKEELPKIKRENISMWTLPYYIDKVEWFASAKDLCNVMNWIRINSENEKEDRTRNILSINPGTNISNDKWNYVGYKGGSEPGVMSMNYLLRSSQGEWFAFSCSVNSKLTAIDESKFAGLVSRAIKLLEK